MLPAGQERALIKAVVDGDRDAAQRLVQAYQGPLYGYMLRLCGRPEVAEDVVQEAFVRALTNLHRYDPQYRFSTWLFTIAKRLHVNARARLAPSFDSDAMGAASDAQAAARTGDDLLVDRLDGVGSAAGASLHRALAKLNAEQREVVVLFYQLNWSVEQIGEQLDVPVGTVKSHLFRARARLRSALAEDQAVQAWLAEVPA
jgi:RNA polymerase sigma-70 factor (ECF subfamily)